MQLNESVTRASFIPTMFTQPYLTSIQLTDTPSIHYAMNVNDSLIKATTQIGKSQVILSILFKPEIREKMNQLNNNSIQNFTVFDHSRIVDVSQLNPKKTLRSFTNSDFTNPNSSLHLKHYHLEEAMSRQEYESQFEERKRTDNLSILCDFGKLEANWNHNGAEKFEASLLNRCRLLLRHLIKQPDIFPTARNSVQMEYEKENGDYLEFEIFKDNVEVFAIINNVEYTESIPQIDSVKLNNLVRDFHAE